MELNPLVIEAALAFAHALVGGDFDSAHRMLSISLQQETTIDALRRDYESMTSYWDGPPDTVKVGLVLPPGETEGIPDGLGWVFVDIDRLHGTSSLGALLEQVGLLMIEEGSRFAINQIEWGRP